MLNDVTRILAHKGWKAEVEYVQDIERIIAYGVMSTPALVINEKVVMLGHRGSKDIEKMLQNTMDSERTR